MYNVQSAVCTVESVPLLMTASDNPRNSPSKGIFFKLCGYPHHKLQFGNYVIGSSIRWKGKVLSKY